MVIKNLRGGKFLPGVCAADGTVTVYANPASALKAATKSGGAFFWFRLNQTMINDAVLPRLNPASVAAVAAAVAALPVPAEGETRTAEQTVAAALANCAPEIAAAYADLEKPAFVNPRVSKADLLLRQIQDAADAVEPAAAE